MIRFEGKINLSRFSMVQAGLGLVMLGFIALATASFPVYAQQQSETPAETAGDAPVQAQEKAEESPWLLAPIFSSNPSLGTSIGAMGGYIHYFDKKSRPSIFAVSAQYSDTDSIVGGAFGKASFDEDRQRLIAALIYGYVKNDYSDYLGTGVPLKSNIDLRGFLTRYLYRVKGPWFVGAQGLYQNFGISGETEFDQAILDILGVEPYKSGGVGLVVEGDTRDNENMPTRGWLVNINNMAYLESLGSDDDFDVYRIEFRYYFPQAHRNVFALRQLNHLTRNAPLQVRAPVQLRGYKIGQYNGVYMSSIEGEERWRLAEKWTATVFLGVACLYGGGDDCFNARNSFWSGGAGVQYILKPKEGIVLNLEYAKGESDNSGIYLKMGYGY